MDIEIIRKNYDEGMYRYKPEQPFPKRLAFDYIFDENLSVKRNRELVEEHNQKVDALKKEQNEKQAAMCQKLTEDVIKYILEAYSLNRRQAELVESYVYKEKHSFMCDYFSTIDEVASFAEDVVCAL